MRRHARASSAASTKRKATLLLTLGAAIFLLVPASQAWGLVVTVDLDGAATGTVTSSPAGIECSNEVGGTPGPACSFDFPPATNVELTAAPGSASAFSGWNGGNGSGTCASGAANPCSFLVLFLPVSVTATFVPLPDPPHATTDSPSVVGDLGATLNGRVNPGGSEVEGCRFEYGTTTDYGATLPCVPAASELGEENDDIAVSAETPPLEAGTTYHYRLLASNLGGVSRGEDRAFTTTGAPACANHDRRLEQGIGTILLPDCMALEMVSPPVKFNAPARSPAFSVDGERVRFNSTAALAGTPGLIDPANGDNYIATRGAGGWHTAYTSPPAPYFKSAGSSGAVSYTPDFSCWLRVAATPLQAEQLKIGHVSRGCLGGVFSSLSPLAEAVIGSTFQGASADQSHYYFKPAGGPEPTGPGSDPNAYVAHLDSDGQPSLALLARDEVGLDAGKKWGGNCGARLGGVRGLIPSSAPARNGLRNQGAVSADGSRVYFSTRANQPQTGPCTDPAGGGNKLRILERLETPAGPEIDELFSSECDREAPEPACATHDGDDLYQGASVDQTKVYFTTNRQLADTDLDGSATQCGLTTAVAGCDLYLYDSTEPEDERLTQVSAGEDNAQHEAGEEARVFNSIAAISGDGSRVYFVAAGVLTEAENPLGETATDGQPNLYLWDAETEGVAFIGTLAPGASGDERSLWGSGATTWRNNAYPVPATDTDEQGNEVGGDGRVLLFLSKAALTGDDADGGFRDAFRYDAEAGQLNCVSCRPGAPDGEPFDVVAGRRSVTVTDSAAPGTDFAEEGRWVSEDGDAVVFETVQPLLPGDRNGAQDAYLWHSGRLARQPGVLNLTNASPAVLSHDGAQVAFSSYSRLLPQDGDTAADVYVARSSGGYPVPSAAKICAGEECQGPAEAPPAESGAASESLLGSANVKPRPRCGLTAKRARRLAQRAKRLRRNARKVGNARKARRMRGKAKRLGGRARGLSRNAKRCRRANRRAAR